MPCHSDPQDEADARLVADHFRIPTIRVDLAPAFDDFTATLRDAMRRDPEGAAPGRIRGRDDLEAQAAARERQAAAAHDDALLTSPIR